jgi:hypothetical protein
MLKDLLFTSLFFLIASFSLIGQESVQLKMNLEVGDKYSIFLPINMNMDITMSIDKEALSEVLLEKEIAIPEKKSKKEKNKTAEEIQSPAIEKMSLNLNLGIFLRFKVIEFKEDIYNLQVFYDRFKIEMNSGDSLFIMDTNTEPNNIKNDLQKEWKNLKKITEQEFFIEVSSLGDIQKVRNYDRIKNILNSSPLNSLMEEDKEAFFAYEYLDLDKLKSTWQSVFKIYPEQPVAIGESWVIQTFDEDKFAPMKSTDTYTLKEITEESYIIEYNSIISDNTSFETISPVLITGVASGTINLSRSDNFQQTHPYALEMDMSMNFMGINMLTKTSAKDVYKVEKIN